MEAITIIYFIMFFFGIYFLMMFIILFNRHKKNLEEYPEPKLFPTVSFIVPAYNEEESIANTITALLAVNYPKGKKEILVVNDGSKDRTSEIVKAFMKKHKEVKLLEKLNSGKADSINQALKVIRGELIAITDADSYPEPDSLIKMVGYFEEDENVAAVTSRVLVKNKKNFIERFQAFDYVVIAWSRKILDYIDSVYVTNGPLSIYRAGVVKKLGGFDTRNLTEDIEITWRLLSRGYKTKMSYSTKVYTTVPSDFNKWVKQRVRWNLGGLQTIMKYKKYIFQGKNFFGFFVIPYVTLSFFLALVGVALLIRYVWIKSSIWLFSIPYFLRGYNPFRFMSFSLPITILMILGLIFFVLAIWYYKSAIEGQEIKNKGIISILTYSIIYRSLYTIPLLICLYKLLKRDIRWYTK